MSVVNLVSEQVITLHQLSVYANGLEDQQRQLYVEKLTKCDVDCPYFIPEQNWLANSELIEQICPPITEEDLFIFLIAQRSDSTGLQYRAFRSIIAGSEMVDKGWVNQLRAIRIRSGSVIFKARVKHSMSFNSRPNLKTWAAIHHEGTVMAVHCTCVAG